MAKIRALKHRPTNGSTKAPARISAASTDIEKRKYELGIIAREDLQHYDPDNDFDTKDSVFSLLVDGDIDYIEPTLCGDVDDVNTRKRSRENPSLPDGVWGRAGEEERNRLSTPVDDDARPVFAKGREKAATTFLGAYEVGARKTCKGPCGRSKGPGAFRLKPMPPMAGTRCAKHAGRKSCHRIARMRGQGLNPCTR